jgi:hypothetical protein
MEPIKRAVVQCPQCETRRTIAEAGGWRCKGCNLGFCPFCLGHLVDRPPCEHVLASSAGELGWNHSPFDGEDLPYVRVPDLFEREISADELRRCFGQFASAVEQAYDSSDGELGEPPNATGQQSLFSSFAERLTTPIVTSKWEGQMIGSSAGVDYYTLHRDRALEEVRVMLDELRAGFKRLQKFVDADV